MNDKLIAGIISFGILLGTLFQLAVGFCLLWLLWLGIQYLRTLV